MSAPSAHRSAVVIGSGVIGTACAYYLMRAGWQVSLIDRGEFASGSSHANCGFICPSHVLPLAEPGMVFDHRLCGGPGGAEISRPAESVRRPQGDAGQKDASCDHQ